MYLFLIIVIICVGLAIWSYIRDYNDIASGFFTFIFGFLILCMIAGIGSKLYLDSNQKDFKWDMTLDKTIYIRTLNDKTGSISGNFLLGTGTISTTSYYFFYAIDDDSTFYLDKLNTEYVKIRETDIKNAHIKKFNFTLTPGQTDWLMVGNALREKCYIYVPKGTIIINYNLDTK